MSAVRLPINYYIKPDLRSLYVLESFYLASKASFPASAQDVCGRPISATSFTQSSQSSTREVSTFPQKSVLFFNLPSDIRRLVTDQLFMSCRHDLEINPWIRIDRVTWSGRAPYIIVYLPTDFLQLFTSKQFFREAIESFISSTNINLANCDATDLLDGTESISSIKPILRRILAQSTQISIGGSCICEKLVSDCKQNMLQSLALYVNKVRRIEIRHLHSYNWMRLPSGFSYIKRNRPSVPDRSTQFVETPIAELRRCETQKIYPYAMKEDLQRLFFESQAFHKAQELVETLRITGKQVSVRYCGVVVYCHVDYSSSTDGHHDVVLSRPLSAYELYDEFQEAVVSQCYYRIAGLAEIVLTQIV